MKERRNRRKQWLAYVLVLALLFTLTPVGNFGGVLAAEDEWIDSGLVLNGDFSSGEENWILDLQDSYSIGEPDNKNEVDGVSHGAELGIWKTSEARDFAISQDVTVPAGTYKLSFRYSGSVQYADTKAEIVGKVDAKSLTGWNAWDEWGTFETDSFTVAEEETVQIKISGTMPADHNGVYLDDIQLLKKLQSESESGVDFVNGDFSDDLNGWTFSCNPTEGTVKVTADSGSSKPTNKFIKIDGVKNNTSFSLSQTISNVPAGDYVVEFEQEGDRSSSGLVLVVNGVEKKVKDTIGWDDWQKVTSKVVTLESKGDVTVSLSGTLKGGYWGGFDNFVLRKATEDDYVPEGNSLNLTTKKITRVEAGDVLLLNTQAVIDGDELSSVGSYELNWKADNTEEGHESGNTDAKFEKDGFSANVTFPSVGTYYIVVELTEAGEVLATDNITITVKEASSVVENDDISVAKVVGLDEEFFMGMDISSAISLFESGVTFKDWNGKEIGNVTELCQFLAANGITHIRIRVWNDPYNANGNGYGGGNNDVPKAKLFADACRAAGIKMMVDFHCSDLWTDPGKYQAPKAWKNLSLSEKEAQLKSFIKESLDTIDPDKDTVTMVQVGNETTGGFVGEKDWTNMCTLFKAGAAGVKEYNNDVKVVIHVTNPEKDNVKKWADTLNTQKVDYDILATSYYPYWHGSLDNLKSQLMYVQDQYGKEAMVAETSYAYTLEDSDGHTNTVRVGNNDTANSSLNNYITEPFTVQGQATSIRNLIEAVNAAGGLGVFYWEPAWLTVGDTTGLEGEALEVQIAANKEKWEKYGSGWASSYAAEYDSEDAGVWFGGSAVDNEAMFYPDGTPTPGLRVWEYVKTGAKTGVSVDAIEAPKITIFQGEQYTLPSKLKVSYNSGAVQETVTWEDVAVDTNFLGSHTVTGTVYFSQDVQLGEYANQPSALVICTIVVKSPNLVTDENDASFEIWTNFEANGSGVDDQSYTKGDAKTGKACVHWYWANDSSGTVTYNKPIILEPGDYTFEYVAQGANTSLTAQILDESGEKLFEGEAVNLEGWNTWKTIPVSFKITETTTIKLQLGISITAGGWGTADDMYLYCTKNDYVTHTVTFKSDENQDVVKNVIDGEKVTPPVFTKAGYELSWEQDLTQPVLDNMTVNEVWNPITYSITYNTDGGTLADGSNTEFTVEDEFTLKDPTKENYEFLGWHLGSVVGTTIAEVVQGTVGDLELYAAWSAKEYTITYELNGGTNAESNPAAYTVETDLTLADPTQIGCTFAGWYTDVACTQAFTYTKGTTTGNITLYAKWVIDNYTITYEVNGGTNAATNPTEYTVETDLTLADPARIGCTFAGWYTDTACTQAFTYTKGTTTGNITLYAKWETEEYTITYELNGGTNAESNPATYTVETAWTPAAATRTGYTFGGWYTDEALEDGFTYTKGTTTGNIILYAKWVIDNYTITYELNGGTNAENNPTAYTVETDLTLADPARIGCTFAGWYTDAACTQAFTYTKGTTTGNITLYAKWETENYTITYELNGGTNAESNPAAYTVETAWTPAAATRTGYTFGGWYTDEALEDGFTYTKGTTTGNITLYAKWTPVTYSITYNTDGGTLADGSDTEFTVEDEFTLKDPTKENYEFLGWHVGSVVGTKIAEVVKGTVGDLELYAAWSAKEYTITYELNGGTNAENNPAEYTVETEWTPADATRTGYTFAGWYMDEACENAFTYVKGSTNGNLKVYAKWSKETYTITYELNGGTAPATPNSTTYDIDSELTLGNPDRENYSFDGWYTDAACTQAFTYTKGSTTGNITLYAKWTYNVIVEETDPIVDTPVGEVQTTLVDPVEKLVEALLTPEEKEAVKTQKVSIYLEVEDKSEEVSEDEKQAIEDAAEDYTVGIYLDLSLFKKIGDEEPATIANTVEAITIEIPIPSGLINEDASVSRTYSIVRIHDGIATALPTTVKDGILSFASDKFSVYAITYKDEAAGNQGDDNKGDGNHDNNQGGGNTGDDGNTDSNTNSKPNVSTSDKPNVSTSDKPNVSTSDKPNASNGTDTGDNTPIMFWSLLLAMAFAGIAAGSVMRRRMRR